MKNWDVIIIGGGIIGLSLSLELRKNGATVLIVERGEPGREASYAAGGMLVDCSIETAPGLQALATASARMYPEFAHELEVESGMKVDLREQGTLLSLSAKHIRHPEFTGAGLYPADLSELEPAMVKLTLDQEFDLKERGIEPEEVATLNEIQDFYCLKERSVDPRALTTAAIKAAKHREVDFSSGDPVTSVKQADRRVVGVTTTKTTFHAPRVVNCAGAWSSQIQPHAFPTRPVKGQMLCLVAPRMLLKHVIRTPEVYLIPRSDGRIIVGTTVEEAGFDKRTDVGTIQGLHRAAIALVP
ncbi:MAG: FAD-dependent oxidoreductase, partial [Candidatus Sulfotelmatobacter sp.]